MMWPKCSTIPVLRSTPERLARPPSTVPPVGTVAGVGTEVSMDVAVVRLKQTDAESLAIAVEERQVVVHTAAGE